MFLRCVLEAEPMPVDLATKTPVELNNFLENRRRAGDTSSEIYMAWLDEAQRRKGFEPDKSRQTILAAAKQRSFLSYKDLSDASGLNWSKVHYSIGKHLWDLIEPIYRRHEILVSAIVVNKPNVASGKMDPETLRGFITAAETLGVAVDADHAAFLKKSQEAVFAAAETLERF